MNLPAETVSVSEDLIVRATELLAKTPAPVSVADIQKELGVEAKADVARLKTELAAACEAGKIGNWGSPKSPKYWAQGPVDYFTPKVLDALSEGPQTASAINAQLKNAPGAVAPPAGTVAEILSKLKGEERAFPWGETPTSAYGLKNPTQQCEEELAKLAAQGPIAKAKLAGQMKSAIRMAPPAASLQLAIDSLVNSGRLFRHPDGSLRTDAPKNPQDELLKLAAEGPIAKNALAGRLKSALGYAPAKPVVEELVEGLVNSGRLFRHPDGSLRTDAPKNPQDELLKLAAESPIAKATLAGRLKSALGYAPAKPVVEAAVESLLSSGRLFRFPDGSLRLEAPKNPEEEVLKLAAAGPIKKAELASQLKAALGFAPAKPAIDQAVENLLSAGKLFLHADKTLRRDAPLDAPAVASKLEAMLANLKQMAPESYPPTVGYLASRLELKLNDPLIVKALELADERLAIPFAKPTADAPIALWEDRVRLLQDHNFIQTVFRLVKKGASGPVDLAKLPAAVAPRLRPEFESALQQLLSRESMPSNLHWFQDGPKTKLIDSSDLFPRTPKPGSPAVPAVASSATASSATVTPSKPDTANASDFAAAFDAAFTKLDARRFNLVSLFELRKALSQFDRETFDRGIRELRKSGRYSLSAGQSQQGFRPEEREAGIQEVDVLLLFVTKES